MDDMLSGRWTAASESLRSGIQTQCPCCGFFNFTDRSALPCPSNATTGCRTFLSEELAGYSTYVEAGGLALIFTQLVVMSLGMVLVCQDKDKDKDKDGVEAKSTRPRHSTSS